MVKRVSLSCQKISWMNDFTQDSTIIKYVDASTDMLSHFLNQIENKRCIYPWESKSERLERFRQIEISRNAILSELRGRI